MKTGAQRPDRENDNCMLKTIRSAATAPFLVPDRAGLRAKISSLDGIWARRWQYFLGEAEERVCMPRWYGSGDGGRLMHAPFAWLATGDRHWAEVACDNLRWVRAHYAETLKVGAQDLDTWIHAAGFLRCAIALDWVWDAGVLSDGEKVELAEWLLTDSLRYPYVVLHHRVPPHANNQGLAQALNLVTVGYLFGVKRGTDARARHLLEFGLPHLLQQIALLPPDGYSGEGSTYICLVADPMMALACAALETVTGTRVFDREFWPSRNSVAKILRLNAHLIPPSSLLPAWDQHGYHLQKAGTTAAYLAHRTGDSSGYHPYLFGDGWEFSGHFAWLRDDHVWQWLWMPAPGCVPVPERGGQCYPESWAENRVAGALLDRRAHLHLFQMWDVSTPFPVRLHMNPNSLLLEAWGSVLTVDGNATEAFALSADPRMQFLHWSMKVPTRISWAFGSLGAHSVILVDGGVAHRARSGGFENLPGETACGFLRRIEQADGWQAVAAEVANFYDNAYDVRSMIRTSALVADSFWAVLDQVRADTAHDFTWQLVLRAGAHATPYGARLVTAEAVVLDVFSLDGADVELHDVPGYPTTLEQRCHHLRKTRRGGAVEFLTVLVPQVARREVADWSADWRGAWEPADQPLADADGSDAPVELRDVFYGATVDRPVFRVARQCVVPPPAMAGEGRWLLELPRSFPLRLWIDGQEVVVPPLMSSHHGEPRLQAPFVDVTEHLRGRPSVGIGLRIRQPRPGAMGLTGGVRLHAIIDVPVPQVERRSDGTVHVAYGAVDTTFALERLRTPAAPLPQPAPEGDEPVRAGQELARAVLAAAPAEKTLEWDGDATARGQACAAALARPLAEVEDRLLECCDDADWVVRLLAIRALGMLHSQRAVPRLRALLAGETPARIRAPDYPPKYRLKEMCLVALGAIGDRSAVPEVAACLVPEDFYGVRRLAAELLGNLGDPSVVPVLQTWAADSDYETGAAARRALARLGVDPRSEMERAR